MSTPDWRIYLGTGGPHDGIARLPAPPPWRAGGAGREERAAAYQADPRAVQMVNAALYLRRPLLVTGPPGSGKSTLADAVAHELKLGAVLSWPINSRTTLKDGLYSYDAVARLRDVQLAGPATRPAHEDIGRYLRLGPLGTALVPSDVPRVVLIDEIDKGDVDLPNDLLHVIEEGEFPIPELERIAKEQGTVRVPDADGREVEVRAGRVCCKQYPLVVMTSNAERDFPPAFLRRCLQLDIQPPDEQRLAAIVRAHLGDAGAAALGPLLAEFVRQKNRAADQLLNAVFLVTAGRLPEGPGRDALVQALLRELESP